MSNSNRGKVWLTDLGSGRGHEQSGRRPVLILSVNIFNHSGADLVVVLPITSKVKHIRSHVSVIPPEGGLSLPSFIKCEDVRSISRERLHKRMGIVAEATMADVEKRVRYLLGL